MKSMLLIFSVLLSFLSGGRSDAVRDIPAHERSVCDNPTEEKGIDLSPGRDICITAASGYSFAGGGSSNSVSARVNQSGRRTSSQIRSTSRIIKGGKVIDNNRLHPFLSQSIVHQAGLYIPERYLFSICRLRL